MGKDNWVVREGNVVNTGTGNGLETLDVVSNNLYATDYYLLPEIHTKSVNHVGDLSIYRKRGYYPRRSVARECHGVFLLIAGRQQYIHLGCITELSSEGIERDRLGEVVASIGIRKTLCNQTSREW